jgi:selenocysteine lyase/cysteine desulfurase
MASKTTQNGTSLRSGPTSLMVDIVKADFPLLDQTIHGHKLVYLDNAASSQKPRVVINALLDYYRKTNANIHRGLHTLAERATDSYERTRDHVARFVGGLAQKKKAVLKHIPITICGHLDLSQIDDIITPKTKLLALTHMSNVLICRSIFRLWASISVLSPPTKCWDRPVWVSSMENGNCWIKCRPTKWAVR